MVMPGVTTRKPREKRLLLGWRAALTVCQAISIAMTVVLPAPVASFSARRSSSGLACGVGALDVVPEFAAARRPCFGATSVSQIAVSTASIWQKKGRTPWKLSLRQCFRSRRGLRRDEPLLGIGQGAPRLDVGPEFVDDRGRVVFLVIRREVVAGVEGH